jgi:hypothetical protein
MNIDAMKEAGVKIVGVKIDRKLVIFDNDLVLPIVAFVDECGEETEPERAVAYDFGTEEFGYGHAPFTYDDQVKEAM